MKTIVIRTLGGKKIGYGHFYRCLSLAKGLNYLKGDISILFMINEELVELMKENNFEYGISNDLKNDVIVLEKLSVDLFIFDSYLGNNEYLREIKKQSKLMLIDDNNDIYDSSIPDIIYNGNLYASDLPYTKTKNQLLLLGSNYLLMKEEYWFNNDDQIHKKGILVTTGGTDSYGIMLKILDIIKKIDIKTKIVIGPGYSNEYINQIENLKVENVDLVYKPTSLKKYIAESKVVLTAGGSTVYEVLSQKSVPVLFSMADNQDLICSALKQLGFEYVGKHPQIDYSKLSSVLKDTYNQYQAKKSLFNLVDGKGTLLVAKEILKCIE